MIRCWRQNPKGFASNLLDLIVFIPGLGEVRALAEAGEVVVPANLIVYTAVKEGKVIYVGITNNRAKTRGQHAGGFAIGAVPGASGLTRFEA